MNEGYRKIEMTVHMSDDSPVTSTIHKIVRGNFNTGGGSWTYCFFTKMTNELSHNF
jgi:hypothetical protein